jgi:hypothetical protein
LPSTNGNITILCDQNMNVRRVRMNGTNPVKLAPSPMGDSVGHWQGIVNGRDLIDQDILRSGD